MVEALEENGLALQYLVPELQADVDTALCAVRQNGPALQFVHGDPMQGYHDTEEDSAPGRPAGSPKLWSSRRCRKSRRSAAPCPFLAHCEYPQYPEIVPCFMSLSLFL